MCAMSMGRNNGLISVEKETSGIRSPRTSDHTAVGNRCDSCAVVGRTLLRIPANPFKKASSRPLVLQWGHWPPSLSSQEGSYYAAISAVAASSELEVIVPLRPVGKNPPCAHRAFPPNARYSTSPAVLVAT